VTVKKKADVRSVRLTTANCLITPIITVFGTIAVQCLRYTHTIIAAKAVFQRSASCQQTNNISCKLYKYIYAYVLCFQKHLLYHYKNLLVKLSASMHNKC